ncbi:hypothetical protein GCM10010172_65560 [Paractinoplanes ferrugineus]|uniref:Uncharacterized protein n=1 Tax=Paractinoplanes ferrugineus TaxID=113564 RepID=A0A919J3I4_9ACTN|nr:hypothetical protein [Actinoplanes ferrugineus]GIE13283.1 hypothetical protein Afe05nite_51230 [Actinoplanes ferrugineus]
MDTPDDTTRTGTLQGALRYLVLGLFACTAALIAVLVGEAVVSAAGWNSDPHGYGVIFAILGAAVLTPVALALWLLYRWMRRRSS